MNLNPEILSIEQMYKADKLAIDRGISGLELMENAGQGVAAFIEKSWDLCPVTILCGPGNNGGDGYVVARALTEAGWPVQVFSLGDPDKLPGDALDMCRAYNGHIGSLDHLRLSSDGLLVDAVFGAGFRGTLPPEISDVFNAAYKQGLPIVAIDMPSGVDGNTGSVSPGTPTAVMTVTFFKAKPGHFLFPGRSHTGLVEVIDIGIPEAVLDQLEIDLWHNGPNIWAEQLPELSATGHKYHRGHLAICGGGVSSTGAARIAARCALRSGAGAVTVVAPPSAMLTYSTALEAVMLASQPQTDFNDWIAEKRIGTVIVGPGNGVNGRTRENVLQSLSSAANVILDADALTVFQEDPDLLFTAIKAKSEGEVILTPHDAEFNRLFNLSGDSLERVRKATIVSGAIILLKGATTIVAHPDGEIVLNIHAPHWMATAGSGDALAGIIGGLVSGGMEPFLAVVAATWIHGQAGYQFGKGMIAEDIEKEIPRILQSF